MSNIWYFQTIPCSAVVLGDDEDEAGARFKDELEDTPDHEYMECVQLKGPKDFPHKDFKIWRDIELEDGRTVAEHLWGEPVRIPDTEKTLYFPEGYAETLEGLMAYRDVFGRMVEDGHQMFGPWIWLSTEGGIHYRVRHRMVDAETLEFRKDAASPEITITINTLLELYRE